MSKAHRCKRIVYAGEKMRGTCTRTATHGEFCWQHANGLGRNDEHDRWALFKFAELLGFHLDREAPSHMKAIEEFEREYRIVTR